MIRLFLITLYLVLAIAEQAYAFGPGSVENNKKGIEEYNGENYTESFHSFSKALGSEPYNPQLQINLGDSFFKGGEFDKSVQSFQAALEQPKITPEQKLQAYFNAGNAARDAKKIDDALNFWQKALEIEPDNKMVKTNIELALKQQQGGGGGEGKDQKDDKDGKDKKENPDGKGDQKKQPQQPPQGKPKPQPFKSQDLTEQDVKRILEELKRQEQQTRAKQLDNKKTKDQNPDKDW